MKTIFSIYFILIGTIAVAQPCKVHNTSDPINNPNEQPDAAHPYGISTNWVAPYNPNLPSPYLINNFDWTFINPFTFNLAQIELSGMQGQEGIDLMANPFDPANNYESLVGNVSWENMDFHWEDGWELLAMNTGFYPDGTEMSGLPDPEEPLFPNNPTFLFYNKQRGIIRLFSNFIGPLAEDPRTVRVTLKFSDPDQEVSGLLRTVNPIDNPLNHETTALAVTNVVDFENNDNL